MKKEVLTFKEKFIKFFQRKKRRNLVVTGVAFVVLFCTVFVLRDVTAVTFDGDAAMITSGAMQTAGLPEEYVDGGTIDGTEITWSITKNSMDEYTMRFDGEGAIPDYTSNGTKPWENYSKTYMKLVIGDGITRIGSYAMKKMHITSIEWGTGLTTVGKGAFATLYYKSPLVIPGTIKTIEQDGFSYFTFENCTPQLTIEEGVESIGVGAFISWNSSVVVNIPASVTSIGMNICSTAAKYVVDENNQNYCSVDGVLYNKDMTVLVDYPKRQVAEEYHVPRSVTEIGNHALQEVKNVKKLYIHNGVTKMYTYLIASSNYTEVYFEEGTNITTMWNWFAGDTMLEVLQLPENGEIVFDRSFTSGTFLLQELTIPSGTTKILQQQYTGSTLKFPCLESITYNAANATIDVGDILGQIPDLDLTIGPDVDVLPSNFSYFAKHTANIYFAPGNTFYAEEGAFEGAAKPLCDLSGNLYPDENGLLYSYNTDDNTATLVYCPPGVSQATIPTEITPQEGVTCRVTSVASNALKCADDLTELTFEDTTVIESLGAYALARCTTLSSVNGQTTVANAEALFADADMGYGVFYNTGLLGAGGTASFAENMNGRGSLNITSENVSALYISVESDGGTMKWVADEQDSELGGYRLLTGDTLTVLASASSDESARSCVYRVYYRITEDDGAISISPGQTYTFNGQTAACYATEDPNTVYLEFSPEVGSTVSIPVTVIYPSPASSGGGMTAWGMIMTADEAAEKQGQLVEPASENDVIQAYWTTEPDEFEVTKSSSGAPGIGVTSDANGNILPNASMNWQIKLLRTTENTSSYGKDYVKSVEFTDTLTLPAGMSWNSDVKDAIINGTVKRTGSNLYVGDNQIISIGVGGSNLSLSGLTIEWDEDQDTAVVSWRVINTNESAEISAATVNFIFYPASFSLDMNVFTPSDKHTISNYLSGKINYHYSNSVEMVSSATKTISGGNGNINLKKTSNKTSKETLFFGEDITYTLDVYNDGGLIWQGNSGIYELRDTLSQYSYISTANMQKMFNEEYGDDLTITITNAEIATWEKALGTDETDSWRTPGNSNLSTETQTLTITKGNDGYTVSVSDSNSYTESELDAALQKSGYDVTGNAQYQCSWKLNSEDELCKLKPGEHRIEYVYATVKDTFLMLASDRPNYYPTERSVSLANTAGVYRNVTQHVISRSVNNSAKREATISQAVYIDNSYLGSKPSASNGDVMTYQLNFTHFGKGEYNNLPLVDDLYGSQYLLVPVEYNSDLQDKNLEIITASDGTQYYKLTEGTYSNVKVGTDSGNNVLNAATITVTTPSKDDGSTQEYSGLHTQIKWYFPHLDSGSYQLVVSFQTVVDMSLSGLEYSIGNMVWVNDRTDDRIYDSLWGGGTLIDFQKDIVTQQGEKPDLDVLDDDAYSLVSAGETVTYRLALQTVGDGEINLNGKYIADALPETYGIFQWEKGVNVTDFRIEIDGDAQTNGMDNWSVGTNYNGWAGDGQYIVWPDTSEISYTKRSTVYLYFSLTYPQDTQQADAWSQYADENQGQMLENTLYVYSYPSNVLHELRETGKAFLQKGVYGMYHYKSSSYDYEVAGDSRLYYNNRDRHYRAAAYYVSLYNGGNKRLYLNDLTDILPQGFTYRNLLASGDLSAVDSSDVYSVITPGGSSQGENPLTEVGSTDVVYRSATVTATATDDGVTFSLSSGSGNYPLKYDSEREQYYLDRDEAVVFGYIADIDTAANTNDSSVNTIAMPYTDYLETSLNIVDKSTLPLTAPDSELFLDYNDGSRQVKNGQQMLRDYNLGEGEDQNWLVSDVAVTRGAIIPGVTKYTVSHTNQSGITSDYTSSVNPNDTVNWRVRLHNSGTLSVTDYTFTDIMPAPYVFTGTLKHTLNDSTGNAILDQTLLTFPSNRTGEETAIDVVNSENKTYSVPFDGTWVEIEKQIYISMSRENGNEVLKIRFENPTYSIPEVGYEDIWLSSLNPTNSYQNTVYTNQALLTPNSQKFTTVQQGSMVRDENGKPVSAKNSSPVIVSFGYSTSSVKQVTQVNNDSNTADSTDSENNVIILPDADSEFTYNLTVSNDTQQTMTKLVLIDNLPNVGDHSPFDVNSGRGSEFKVSLAQQPDFCVTITPESGEPYELDSSLFKVQYSTSTNFGGSQSADWNGDDDNTTATWSNDPTGARSIRVVISADIPALAKASFSFRAKVDGDTQPGQIAWNSFGYHYGLNDISIELEAMPLTVGVQIPTVPSVTKQLVDQSGQSLTTDKDAAFSFIVYEGAALEDKFDTADALIQALIEASRSYHQFDLTVKEGKSASDLLYLEAITWQKGQKYTIVELPLSGEFTFRSFTGSELESYTFTYDPSIKQDIICDNTFVMWSVSVTKQNPDNQPLEGAVFALYSKNEADKIDIPAEYQDIDIASEIERDGQTWYLAGVDCSDDTGKLEWVGLVQEQYILLEVKAPDGYYLDNPQGYVLNRNDSENAVYTMTVVNHTGALLPTSGGIGTIVFIASGFMLALGAAALLLMHFIKRRQDEFTSL